MEWVMNVKQAATQYQPDAGSLLAAAGTPGQTALRQWFLMKKASGLELQIFGVSDAAYAQQACWLLAAEWAPGE